MIEADRSQAREVICLELSSLLDDTDAPGAEAEL